MGLRLLPGLLDGSTGMLYPRSKGSLRVPKAGTQGLSQLLVIGYLGPVHPSVAPQGRRALLGARWDTAVPPIGWGLALASSPHPCSPQGAAPCSVDELALPSRRSLQAADISFGCWVGRPSATLLSHG